ncbi:MAG: hypothetical protein QMC35_11345, partial [Polaribacter sp.]
QLHTLDKKFIALLEGFTQGLNAFAKKHQKKF